MSPDLIRGLQSRTLEAVPVRLGPREYPVRSLYWLPGVMRWCEAADASAERPQAILSPSQEINQSFADFVSGRPLAGGFTRCSPPAGEGVWKLHTPSIRFFGWCVEAQHLVLTGAEWKHVLASGGSPTYSEMSRAVVQTRNLLGFRDYHAGDIRSAFPTSS